MLTDRFRGTPRPASPSAGSPVRRRTLLTGTAGASLALMALAACDEEDAELGPQEPDTEAVADPEVV